MKRFYLLGLLLLYFMLPSFAQDNEQTPYEIALQRIEEARVSGATELDLSGLGLTELPPEIGNLSHLEVLELAYNQLESLPAEIGRLSSLKVLSVPGNQLRSLPPEIGQLSNLCYLDLSENHLQSLPQELGQLYQLTVVDCNSIPAPYTFLVYGNPLGSLANSRSIQYDPLAILDYLRNEAWWHLQRLIAGAATSVGIVAALVLGLRWKSRRGRKEKEKRG